MRIDELPFAGGAPRLGRLSLRRADVVTGRLLYADDSPGVGLVVRYVGGQKRPLWVHLDTRADEAGAFCFVLDAGGSGTVSALQFEQQDRRPGVSMRVVGGQDITLRLETVPLRLRLVDESGRPVEDFCFHGPRIQRDEGPHPDGVVAAPASLLEIRPWLMFTFADRPFGVLRGCVVRGTGTDP